MTKEEQLNNTTLLIQQLSEENETLKTQLSELELKYSLYKKEYDSSLEEAKKIIALCVTSEKEYKEAINSVKKAQEEYKSAINEIYKLKKQYKNVIRKITKTIDK